MHRASHNELSHRLWKTFKFFVVAFATGPDCGALASRAVAQLRFGCSAASAQEIVVIPGIFLTCANDSGNRKTESTAKTIPGAQRSDGAFTHVDPLPSSCGWIMRPSLPLCQLPWWTLCAA